MILTLRHNEFKVAVILLLIPVKGYYIGWDCGAFTTLYTFVVAIFFDIFTRRSFRLQYEANETTKKFQSLLTNDFVVNMLLVSCKDPKIPIFQNSTFKETFKSDSAKFEEILLHMTLKHHVESFTANNMSKNLLQEMISLSNDCENDKEYNYTIHWEKDQRIFDIKIKKIAWGNEDCYCCIFNDVTEKEAFLAIKQANEYKDRVIAAVSHKLRTPINGMMGLFGEIKTADKDSKSCLDNCVSCAKLLLYFVNSILDHNQIVAKKIELVKTLFTI
jgi:signal transduction histidine kinase